MDTVGRAERAGWSSSTNTRRRLAATKSEPGPETSETPAETVEAPEPAETTAEPLAPAAGVCAHVQGRHVIVGFRSYPQRNAADGTCLWLGAASGDSIDFVVDKADKAEKNISFEGVMAEAGRINWPPLGQVR
jgi:hypothetical protein